MKTSTKENERLSSGFHPPSLIIKFCYFFSKVVAEQIVKLIKCVEITFYYHIVKIIDGGGLYTVVLLNFILSKGKIIIDVIMLDIEI